MNPRTGMGSLCGEDRMDWEMMNVFIISQPDFYFARTSLRKHRAVRGGSSLLP